jgi:hypothetical protein
VSWSRKNAGGRLTGGGDSRSNRSRRAARLAADFRARASARRCAAVRAAVIADRAVAGVAVCTGAGEVRAVGAGATGVTSPAVRGASPECCGVCVCPPPGAASGRICVEGSGDGGVPARPSEAHRHALARATTTIAATTPKPARDAPRNRLTGGITPLGRVHRLRYSHRKTSRGGCQRPVRTPTGLTAV